MDCAKTYTDGETWDAAFIGGQEVLRAYKNGQLIYGMAPDAWYGVGYGGFMILADAFQFLSLQGIDFNVVRKVEIV